MPKIPTKISYGNEAEPKIQWGASVNDNSNAIIGIKLLLDPTQRRPAYLSSENASSDTGALPKSAIDITADFIRKIYEHALSEISKTVPRGYMELCAKKFVLTGKNDSYSLLANYLFTSLTLTQQSQQFGRTQLSMLPCRSVHVFDYA